MSPSRAILVIAGLFLAGPVCAEPWLAINGGNKCMACHVSPTGGGKRTVFGAMYSQTAMTRKMPDQFWDGTVMEKLSIGADVRANALATQIPNQENRFTFDLEEALLYAEFRLIPERLTLYFDERIAPGGASSREAYALYWLKQNRWYVRAGRMFLPFGWRIEDDSEFIRQVPGINYNTPDDGVEVGLELDSASLQLAITNGTAGAGEVDTGKQFSFRGSYVQPLWRAGGSFNFNDADAGGRTMYGVFFGLRTGPVSWLIEADRISDDGFTGGREQELGFIEANWLISKGFNLKATFGHFDPDINISEDEQSRASLVLEMFPIQFTQISVGARSRDGIPQNDLQNTDELFIQLHVYF